MAPIELDSYTRCVCCPEKLMACFTRPLEILSGSFFEAFILRCKMLTLALACSQLEFWCLISSQSDTFPLWLVAPSTVRILLFRHLRALDNVNLCDEVMCKLSQYCHLLALRLQPSLRSDLAPCPIKYGLWNVELNCPRGLSI
jgi:hypothetical protein